ncbi:MAG TPA: glycosyltransferase [Candidatus Polarisedimenticolia bacterium]|nr:glycosyltransferase [Candidatus Polarisedimenticolia bacterium]
MSRARIAYILTAFPTVSETFVEGEFRALARRGLSLDLYATRNFQEIAPGDEPATSTGLHVERSPYLWSAEIPRAFFYFLSRRPARTLGTLAKILIGNARSPRYLSHALALFPKCLVFARLMERRGTSHVHGTWAHYPATVAYVTSRILGISYSFAGHAGLDVLSDRTFLATKLRSARFVLTCHHSTRRSLERLVPGASPKIHTVYHGVALSEVPRPGEAPKADPPEIVSVGRLTPEKGFLYLLQACALLRQRGVVYRARIFGQGPQRAALQREIDRLGLQDTIALEGVVPHSRILDVLARATVVTLPSYLPPNFFQDGIANVLVEAMACGTPVVSTDYDGSRELLEGGKSGILVPEKDARSLEAALAEILGDSARRSELSRLGRARVEREFNREENVTRILELFRPLTSEDSPASPEGSSARGRRADLEVG